MENVALDSREQIEEQDNNFYAVSPKKFTVLFISTLGLYGFYWMYKNWSLYKQSSGENIWPVARAFFDVFFIHSLCSKVCKNEAVSFRKDLDSLLEWKASKYVLLLIAGRIGDRLSDKEIGLPYTYFISLIAFPFIYRSLYKIQLYINEAVNDKGGESNSEFTWFNYVWIFLGSMLWLLVLAGGYFTAIGEL